MTGKPAVQTHCRLLAMAILPPALLIVVMPPALLIAVTVTCCSHIYVLIRVCHHQLLPQGFSAAGVTETGRAKL
jgi:hypothetical protein